MIQTKDFYIKGCDDFELDIKRKTKLHFKLSWDDEKDLKAIVCIISGLGGDSNTHYKEHLIQSLASDNEIAALSVDYHCIGLEPSLGARRFLSDYDIEIFKLVCSKLGFDESIDFDKMNANSAYLDELMQKLKLHIGVLKLQGKVPMDFRAPISWSLEARGGEYQNMGIMSAMDVINALLSAKKILANKNLPVILEGSSHGGYIANICAKIAPWLVDAVIDNLSWNLGENIKWSDKVLSFIGFTKELDPYFCRGCVSDENFVHLFSNTTKWTLDKTSPYYFSTSRHQIRNVNHKEHLLAQSKIKKAKYIGYHLKDDNVASFDDKVLFYENLKELGFDVKLNMIKDKKQIDGKLIKSLEHGMGMSIKMLINKELPPLLNALKDKKASKAPKEVLYQTDEWAYSFKQKGEKLLLECSKIG